MRRSPLQRLLLCGALLAAFWICGLSLGCAPETRYRVLSTVFDGVPQPGEERAERRRPGQPASARLVPEPPAPGPATAPVPPPEPLLTFETFQSLAAAFPKDAAMNVDWVAAIETGLIHPRPGIGRQVQDIPPLPLDVHLDPGIPIFAVVFPHEAHTRWLRCDNCHPAIFQMRAGADTITMSAIFQGEFCGRCHGKVAFAPETGCPRCHVRLQSAGQ